MLQVIAFFLRSNIIFLEEVPEQQTVVDQWGGCLPKLQLIIFQKVAWAWLCRGVDLTVHGGLFALGGLCLILGAHRAVALLQCCASACSMHGSCCCACLGAIAGVSVTQFRNAFLFCQAFRPCFFWLLQSRTALLEPTYPGRAVASQSHIKLWGAGAYAQHCWHGSLHDVLRASMTVT